MNAGNWETGAGRGAGTANSDTANCAADEKFGAMSLDER
jgi:hypothetical protein